MRAHDGEGVAAVGEREAGGGEGEIGVLGGGGVVDADAVGGFGMAPVKV